MSYELLLKYNGSATFKINSLDVVRKLPLGLISLELSIAIKPGQIIADSQNNRLRTIYYLIRPEASILFLDNEELTQTNEIYFHQTDSNGIDRFLKLAVPYNAMNMQIKFMISQELLDYIESKRKDDINLRLKIYVEIFPIDEYINSNTILIDTKKPLQIEIFDISHNINLDYELSAKKWLEFLEKLGYSEKWIIEIDRPKLEGFHEVMAHLEKAKDALYSKTDPEDVLRDLRAARDSFLPFYKEYKDKIMEIIDRDSRGQEGHDDKSKRIDDIFTKISYFLDIGPHSDKYRVTYSDALLAYREFISILSYLSSMISKIQKNNLEESEKNKSSRN